jgi:prevent-host-death family protein
MTEVASRDLRNDTAGVLKRVQAGEDIVITVNRKPVARVVPIAAERRAWLARPDLVRRLSTAQADPGLRDDLARIAGETTDDLGDI